MRAFEEIGGATHPFLTEVSGLTKYVRKDGRGEDVEAFQWTGFNYQDLTAFFGEGAVYHVLGKPDPAMRIEIDSPEMGVLQPDPGDYLARGEMTGPCRFKRQEFEALYRPAEAEVSVTEPPKRSEWKELDAQAQALCDYWQEVLRLQDWTIKCEYVRAYRLDGETYSRAAEISKHRHTQTAEIRVCHPDDIPPYCEAVDPEQSIIHELLHVHLDGWEVEPGTWDFWAQERAINLIADALLKLKRDADRP